MSYDAILFDLDGTLLDTLDDLADSMNAVLQGRGLPTHPVEAYKIFVGDGVVNLVRRALSPGGADDETIRSLVAEMRREYTRRWDVKTRPYEGVPDLLRALGERGVKLTVLSNKPDDFTKLCVERFLGEFRFEAVQGLEDGVKPKPDPSGALRISRALRIPPERFLYVGDTNTDMQTAVQAGMYPVGAAWGFRSAEELRRHGAKAIIDHPSELLGLL